MEYNQRQQLIIDTVIGDTNKVVVGLHDDKGRSGFVSVLYSLIFLGDFIDTCSTISLDSATNDKLLYALRKLNHAFEIHKNSSPINITRAIDYFLEACSNRDAFALLEQIISNHLFSVQFKYGKINHLMMIYSNIHDEVLKQISIRSFDLKLPQKIILKRSQWSKFKPIAIPEVLLFDVRGIKRNYKLNGMITANNDAYQYYYFKNRNCLRCEDDKVMQTNKYVSITNNSQDWITLVYIQTSDTISTKEKVIKCGVEKLVNHDNSSNIVVTNKSTKSFMMINVANGRKCVLEDFSQCSNPVYKKMNEFFSNALTILRSDYFRGKDIGSLNLDMIKVEVTGENSDIYDKCSNRKIALADAYKKNELSVDKIIARLQTHGYDIDQNMIKQRRNKRSIDETPSNEIDFWNDTMETTSINEHEISLMKFNWKEKANELRTENLVKQIAFPYLLKEEADKITCQTEQEPLFEHIDSDSDSNSDSDSDDTNDAQSDDGKISDDDSSDSFEDTIFFIGDSSDDETSDSIDSTSLDSDTNSDEPLQETQNDVHQTVDTGVNDIPDTNSGEPLQETQNDVHQTVDTGVNDIPDTNSSIHQTVDTGVNDDPETNSGIQQTGDKQEQKEIKKRKLLKDLFNLFKATFKYKGKRGIKNALLNWRKTTGYGRGLEIEDIKLSTLYNWNNIIRKGIHQNGRKKYPHRFSPKRKLTFETVHCLFIISIYFPFATNIQKAKYLDEKGPIEAKGITPKTVAKGMKMLSMKLKSAKPYVMQRNTVGAIAARALWSELMLECAQDNNTLFGFIDEASIETEVTKDKSLAFKKFILHTNKQMKCEHISMLACIVPGFGVFVKFVKNSVTADIYENFLKIVAKECRENICNCKTHLLFINDNAAIHKAGTMRNIEDKCHFDLIFTIPYSPHLNAPIENFFGFTKKNYANQVKVDDAESNSDSTLAKLTKEISTILKAKFKAVDSIKYFEHVLMQWKECTEMKPLVSYKIKGTPPFENHQRNVKTMRFFEE